MNNSGAVGDCGGGHHESQPGWNRDKQMSREAKEVQTARNFYFSKRKMNLFEAI